MLSAAPRPRVSRETRRLVTAAALALAALWLLARWRFPERPVGPVATVLTQIAPPASFADLAGEVEDVRRRVGPVLADLALPGIAGPGVRSYPGWPLHGDLALTLLPAAVADDPARVVAWDAPTGLALVRVATDAPGAAGAIWVPERLAQARHFFLAVPAAGAYGLQPVYCGGLQPVHSPAWPGEVWLVPMPSALVAGAQVFTATGEWVGLVAVDDGQAVIVPAATAVVLAERLGAGPRPVAVNIGVSVQRLTPPLAAATGASAGVVVAAVADGSPAAGRLRVGDVIERLDDEAVPSPYAWRVRAARLSAGRTAALQVWRGGTRTTVTVDLPLPLLPQPEALGLTLTRLARRGARVLQVDGGTAADRAGLRAGDILTRVGEVQVPAPAQVQQAWATLPAGGALLVAVTRENQSFAAALTR